MKIEDSPKISIIIVTYNSWPDIKECLDSLKKITYTNIDITIVDNNSPAKSCDLLRNYLKHFPLQAKSYFLQTNTGFAAGNNYAIKKKLKEKGEYFLLLNPDTIIEPDFLDKLVNVAEQWKAKSKLAFFGPRILLWELGIKNKELGRIYSNGGLLNWSQTRGTLKDYGKDVSEVNEIAPFENDYISGTCLLVPKEMISLIGLMREEYFLYYEDPDWAIRARKAGIKQILVPKSIIWHKASTTTKAGSFSYLYYHTRNGLYCGWRNGTIMQKLVVLSLAKWIFIKQPLKFFIPSKRKWAKPVMKGVIDFWRGKMDKMPA